MSTVELAAPTARQSWSAFPPAYFEAKWQSQILPHIYFLVGWKDEACGLFAAGLAASEKTFLLW